MCRHSFSAWHCPHPPGAHSFCTHRKNGEKEAQRGGVWCLLPQTHAHSGLPLRICAARCLRKRKRLPSRRSRLFRHRRRSLAAPFDPHPRYRLQLPIRVELPAQGTDCHGLSGLAMTREELHPQSLPCAKGGGMAQPWRRDCLLAPHACTQSPSRPCGRQPPLHKGAFGAFLSVIAKPHLHDSLLTTPSQGVYHARNHFHQRRP